MISPGNVENEYAMKINDAASMRCGINHGMYRGMVETSMVVRMSERNAYDMPRLAASFPQSLCLKSSSEMNAENDRRYPIELVMTAMNKVSGFST
jgi:hypothetical protein